MDLFAVFKRLIPVIAGGDGVPAHGAYASPGVPWKVVGRENGKLKVTDGTSLIMVLDEGENEGDIVYLER